MATKTQEARFSDGVFWETEQNYTREEVTILSGENLAASDVVGKVTASGKYVAYDNAASDGSQAAAGVLVVAVDASDADTLGAIVIRGPAIVNPDGLGWNTQDAAAQTAGLVDLAALDIIERTGV